MTFPVPYARLYPIIAIRTQGALGRLWIHKQYGTKKVVTRYYYPYEPRTAWQKAWWAVYADAILNWQSFDDATKNYYNQLVRDKNLYGYHRYLSMYLRAHYPPHFDCLLQENGDFLLQENGDKIVL